LIPLGDDRRSNTVPVVVWLLIAINVAVFVTELNAPDTGAFIQSFAAVPYDITNGIVLAPPSPPSPLLTIVTAMFLHGGIAHIGFNMLFLFAFGPTIEASFGHLRFAAFYLLCGIGEPPARDRRVGRHRGRARRIHRDLPDLERPHDRAHRLLSALPTIARAAGDRRVGGGPIRQRIRPTLGPGRKRQPGRGLLRPYRRLLLRRARRGIVSRPGRGKAHLPLVVKH
jgi:hypothetical protein